MQQLGRQDGCGMCFTKLPPDWPLSFLLVSNAITCSVLYLNLFQRPSIHSGPNLISRHSAVALVSPGAVKCVRVCVCFFWLPRRVSAEFKRLGFQLQPVRLVLLQLCMKGKRLRKLKFLLTSRGKKRRKAKQQRGTSRLTLIENDELRRCLFLERR